MYSPTLSLLVVQSTQKQLLYILYHGKILTRKLHCTRQEDKNIYFTQLHIHCTQKQKKNKNYMRWKINYNIYVHTKSQLAYEQKHIQSYNNAIRKWISRFIYNSLKWALSKTTDHYNCALARSEFKAVFTAANRSHLYICLTKRPMNHNLNGLSLPETSVPEVFLIFLWFSSFCN